VQRATFEVDADDEDLTYNACPLGHHVLYHSSLAWRAELCGPSAEKHFQYCMISVFVGTFSLAIWLLVSSQDTDGLTQEQTQARIL
jgi:hypothetical protein